MPSEVEIVNRALVELGLSAKRIGALSDSTPQAEAANAIFTQVRDSLVASSSWNFATRRVWLDEAFDPIGMGTISWGGDIVAVVTKSNVPHGLSVGDTVKIADVVSPTVYNGTYRVSVVWADDSFGYELPLDSDPGSGITTNAWFKRVPAFDFDTYFALPSDMLRLIRTNHPGVRFRIEAGGLFATSDDAPGIVYVRQVADVTELPSYVSEVLALMLAAELAMTLKASQQEKQLLERKAQSKLDDARFYDSIQAPTEVLRASGWADSHRSGSRVIMVDDQRWVL